jgi:signal transduction histidine kinase
MRLDLRSFLPNRISGQIALIVVASLAVIHVVVTTLFFLSRSQHGPDHPFDELVAVARLVDATASPERTQLMAAAITTFPQLGLSYAATAPDADATHAHDRAAEAIEHHLGPGFRVIQVAAAESRDTPLRLAVRLRDGTAVIAQIAPPHGPPPFGGPWVLTIGFIAISLTFLGLWAARVLTSPLRSFAAAAENFSPDGEVASLPERGPTEIRTAARALNRMRARIKELVEGRTRMLAAVSHDLRTPITRLRLRSEFIDDAALRTQMLDELAHMNTMVESILVYLRGGSPRGPATLIDIATSVQTVCDQFADLGHTVAYQGPDHLVLTAHPEELRRAITNLVDNAVRHGREVTVRLSALDAAVSIAVEDDGPGIVEMQKEAMQQPFMRGDAARGMNDNSGFGLGLSITREVVQAHGGTLELIDRIPSGLIARINLPDHRANTPPPAAMNRN